MYRVFIAAPRRAIVKTNKEKGRNRKCGLLFLDETAARIFRGRELYGGQELSPLITVRATYEKAPLTTV